MMYLRKLVNVDNKWENIYKGQNRCYAYSTYETKFNDMMNKLDITVPVV